VPAEIVGVGSTSMKLRVSPGFDPLKAQVGPDEYFLLSRIDGSQTLREVILSTGLPVERAVAIVTRLRSIGALLLPGETAAPVPKPAAAPPPLAARAPVAPLGTAKTPAKPATPAFGVPTVPPQDTQRPPADTSSSIAIARTATPAIPMPLTRLPAKPAPVLGGPSIPALPVSPPPLASPPPRGVNLDAPTNLRSPAVDPPTQRRAAPPPPDAAASEAPTVRRAPPGDINVVLPNATQAEKAALAEPGDLDPDIRLRILAMARLVEGRDPYALLGVPHGADEKTLKRAYFKLSKDIHPDRYYGRKLGSFDDLLNTVFEAVSRTYARLTSPDKSQASASHAAVNEQPQTPQEYASELFERACALEVGGDALGGMKLFAAAVRVDPQTKYLKRAASCALAADQPKTALEYAKKAQGQAPNDPSLARLLANAFKATGKYSDAEDVLVMAMAIKSENDVLTAELWNDLAEVRRLLSG
jgi:DnaJ domain/Tetratricopeptide repeat